MVLESSNTLIYNFTLGVQLGREVVQPKAEANDSQHFHTHQTIHSCPVDGGFVSLEASTPISIEMFDRSIKVITKINFVLICMTLPSKRQKYIEKGMEKEETDTDPGPEVR